MDKDKETEEKKLRDLPPAKDAKGGSGVTANTNAGTTDPNKPAQKTVFSPAKDTQ